MKQEHDGFLSSMLTCASCRIDSTSMTNGVGNCSYNNEEKLLVLSTPYYVARP